MEKNTVNTSLIDSTAIKIIKNHYNFCYLHAMLEKIQHISVENLIVGSSYGLYGIIESLFQNGALNLSMHNQDIYYDFLAVKQAVKNAYTKPKRCFILLGYYALGQDLSSQSRLGHTLIKQIYYPLYRDSHNLDLSEYFDIWKWADVYQTFDCPDNAILELKETIDYFIWQQGSYFNSHCERGTSMSEKLNGILLDKCQPCLRTQLAQERADSHNKLIHYETSICENKQLLDKLMLYLSSQEIQPIIVIPPFSDEYNHFILPAYHEQILNVLEKMPYDIHYIDFNHYKIWSSLDFFDADHLSQQGAIRLSALLNDTFILNQ